MPKNPSPPFSGRSQVLPACLCASARRSCPKALPKNCTLCLKSSCIQNKMKFSPALSQQRREIAYATLPFPAEQRELFVLCCSPTASEWGKKKVAFSFLGVWPTATPGYLLSPGEASLTKRERSCT